MKRLTATLVGFLFSMVMAHPCHSLDPGESHGSNPSNPPRTGASATDAPSGVSFKQSSTTFSYIIPHLPPSNSSWRSRIYLSNPHDHDASCVMAVYQESGENYVRNTAYTYSIPAQSFITLDAITESSAGQRWIGIVTDDTIAGDFSFAINRGTGEEKVTLPIADVTSPHTRLVFPHIPADRGQFWSGFALVNPNGNTNVVEFHLWGDQGHSLDGLLKSRYANGVSLSAWEKRVTLFEGVVFDDSSSAEKVAWVEVSAEHPIVGFELFGKHAEFSQGELAGIEARPIQGANESVTLPLSLSGLDWNGFSLVNTSPQNSTVTITAFDIFGGILDEAQTILGSREKQLGLLNTSSLVFPYGSDSPLMNFDCEADRPVGTIRIQSSQDFAAFSLGGVAGTEFDGTTPGSFSPARGIVAPGTHGSHVVQVISGSNTPDLVALRARDAEGRDLAVYQCSLAPYGMAHVAMGFNPDGPYTIEVAGGSEASQVCAYLLERSFDDGESYTIHSSFAADAEPSQLWVSGEVALPVGVDPQTVKVYSGLNEVDLGHGGKRSGFSIGVGTATGEIIAALGTEDEIYGLAVPMASLARKAKNAQEIHIDAESTALAFALMAPFSGIFNSASFLGDLEAIAADQPEVSELADYLSWRVSHGMAPIDTQDPDLPPKILAAQTATLGALLDQIGTPPDGDAGPVAKDGPQVYLTLQDEAAGANGLLAELSRVQENEVWVSFQNYFYRHVVIHQKANSLDPLEGGLTRVGCVKPANKPLSVATLSNWWSGESLIMSKTTLPGIDIPASHTEFNSLFAIGGGLTNQIAYTRQGRLLQVEPFLRDALHLFVAPVIGLVAGGQQASGVTGSFSQHAHEVLGLYDLLETLAGDALRSIETACVDHEFVSWEEYVEFAVGEIWKSLTTGNPNPLRRFERYMRGMDIRGANGPWDRFVNNLGTVVGAVCSAVNEPFTLMGYVVSLCKLPQSSQYGVHVEGVDEPEIHSFIANPSTIQAGDASTLSWSCSDTTSVTISGVSGSFGASGSRSVSPTRTTSYTLTATGPGGTAQASLTVTVTDPPPQPIIHDFRANPTEIMEGESTTLIWSTSHADYVMISGFSSHFSPDGSRAVSPLESTRYTLTAFGQGGTASRSTDVTVNSEAQSGSLAFRLNWSGESDLDIHVVDPWGEEIYWSNTISYSGGELDVDAIPCGDPGANSVENIFWDEDEVESGTYYYWVYYFDRCGDANPKPCTLRVLIDGSTVVTRNIEVYDEQNSEIFSFQVP